MKPKRFFAAVALALTAALLPVDGRAGSPVGLGVSTAVCAEAGCGGPSKMDCICPDMMERNRRPRCVAPGW